MSAVRSVEATPRRVIVPPPHSERSIFVPDSSTSVVLVSSATVENFAFNSAQVISESCRSRRSMMSLSVSKSVIVSLPSPSPNSKTSAPSPPVSVSSPALPTIRSSPAPPVSVLAEDRRQ